MNNRESMIATWDGLFFSDEMSRPAGKSQVMRWPRPELTMILPPRA
jgi:hypothetical protein